jgi:hypothetical protein
VTRLLLEVTNLETRETKYITVGGEGEVPELVAGYALRYAQALMGQPTEAVPHRLALWPGGEPEDDDAA